MARPFRRSVDSEVRPALTLRFIPIEAIGIAKKSVSGHTVRVVPDEHGTPAAARLFGVFWSSRRAETFDEGCHERGIPLRASGGPTNTSAFVF